MQISTTPAPIGLWVDFNRAIFVEVSVRIEDSDHQEYCGVEVAIAIFSHVLEEKRRGQSLIHVAERKFHADGLVQNESPVQ